MDNPWAKKAVRIGIAIGDADLSVIETFIAHPEFKPLVADNAPTLARYIKWATTAVVKNASAPTSQVAGTSTPSGVNVPVPPPPVPVPPDKSTRMMCGDLLDSSSEGRLVNSPISFQGWRIIGTSVCGSSHKRGGSRTRIIMKGKSLNPAWQLPSLWLMDMAVSDTFAVIWGLASLRIRPSRLSGKWSRDLCPVSVTRVPLSEPLSSLSSEIMRRPSCHSELSGPGGKKSIPTSTRIGSPKPNSNL